MTNQRTHIAPKIPQLNSSLAASMNISSKSILSPGRAGARDPPISLSTSLSRRLRKNGSIKGAASPAMFPAASKKRGCGFDNPEPSSPKVTCIGQVRVKSKKKQAKKLRTLSRSHTNGEASFRNSRDGFGSQSQHLGSNHQHQSLECLTGQRSNQRWVHLPWTICETLRAFGSEFSCLFPCRSSCFSTTEREKEEKTAAEEEGNRQGSCGATLARWLLALQDGGGGGGREIELAAGDEDEEDTGARNSRKHVFEDLEIVNGRIQGTRDEARMSICAPPKNALLLMRCRSDPMKMEALTNRSWEPTTGKNEEEDEDDEEEEEIEEKRITQVLEVEQHQKEEKVEVLDDVNDQEPDNVQVDQEKEETHLELDMKHSIHEEDQEQSLETNEEEEEEGMFLVSLFEENLDQDQETDEAYSDMEDAQEESFEPDEDIQEIEAVESNIEKVKDEETSTELAERSEMPEETHEEEVVMELEEAENGVLERESEVKEKRASINSSTVLPECLLLMMCEPKLSMEVSKETWVCSTDFVRRNSGKKKPPPPPPPFKSIDGQNEPMASATTLLPTGITAPAAPAAAAAIGFQPARSSCSLPAPPSMATVLEQKLAEAVGYEPFVLTRCKSEPLKTAAAKLVPETCFWRNRKLEPLRRAAGLGF